MVQFKVKTPAATPHAPSQPISHSAASLQERFDTLVEQSRDWLFEHTLQILIAAAIGTVIVMALLGIKSLGLRLCRKATSMSDWRMVIGRVLAQTRFLFTVVLAAELVGGFADAPAAVAQTIRFLFVIGLSLQAALWARELILGLVEHRAAHGEADHSALGSALGIIRLLVTIALFAVAIILILDNLGVNVTGLIAGLGIGGIAIGLAAQGIFSDLFAALAILFDRPFRRGDSIQYDKTSGTVEAIGLKTTRLRALTGEEVIISNANLLNKELHNMARLDRRRIVLTLGVIYQTPTDTLEQIPEMVRAIVEGHDKCTVVRIGMTGFGASSLDFELQFDVHSEQYNEVFDTRGKVCLAILAAFNREGIEFAYPTQTSFTAAPDGRAIMPYPEVDAAAQPAAPSSRVHPE